MTHDKFENDNPFSTPVEVSGYVPTPLPMGASGAYVRQVKPLCICMIIQGALEILMGIGYVVLGITMPALVMSQQAAAGGPPVAGQDQIRTILTLVYSVAGVIALIAGVLRLVAGIRGLYFRGYALGLVTHFFGLLNIVTCYCLPTSLGLCIWGCIVYFNPEVKYAFKMGAEGQDPSDIEAGMSGRY